MKLNKILLAGVMSSASALAAQAAELSLVSGSVAGSLAAQALSGLFGAAVAEPVALHVRAKRYLVAVQPTYARALSPDSVRSLALQGGPMTPAECDAFMALPHAQDALRLRVWDDSAKASHLHPESPARALAEPSAAMQAVRPGRRH